MIDLATKLVDEFGFLEQARSKETKARQENESFKRRKATQISH